MRAAAALALVFVWNASARAAGLDAKQLDFRAGEPFVLVGLMQGQREIAFSSPGRVRVRGGGRSVEIPAGAALRARVARGAPAKLAPRVQLAEFRFSDRAALDEARAAWRDRGVPTAVRTVGTLYGIAGKVVDNRTQLLLVDGELTPEEASAKQADLLRRFDARTSIFDELRAPASGTIELLDASGAVLARAADRLDAVSADGAPFDVQRVEFGIGYDFHGFEDRRYRGALRLAVGRDGALAAVNLVPLEALLNGLVPAEIFARAHVEALKAQAVTARGEVLSKVGTRHLADPYHLCAEQHCAVYKGLSGEAPTTNAAVEATRGIALFSPQGRLVDSVYSAVCGGHTEDNENVWGGAPNPSLRGRPDLLLPSGEEPTPEALARFLAAELPAACRLSTLSAPGRFRWERRFTAAEVDALAADLGVGRVLGLAVIARGVSGRARTLLVSGEEGATQLSGELVIRRRFRMLHSAMFEVSAERDETGRATGWTFRGGGWGHGVGMCQTGAIGRAEAGHDYRAILRHYFNGAEVARIY